MDEKDEDVARLTDLDVRWGFDLTAALRERSQETPAAGDAGDLHACLQENLQEAPVAGNSGDGTAETMGSSEGGAVNASSLPAGRAESGSDAWAASGTDRGKSERPQQSCRAGQLTSSVGGDGYPRQ